MISEVSQALTLITFDQESWQIMAQRFCLLRFCIRIVLATKARSMLGKVSTKCLAASVNT